MKCLVVLVLVGLSISSFSQDVAYANGRSFQGDFISFDKGQVEFRIDGMQSTFQSVDSLYFSKYKKSMVSTYRSMEIAGIPISFGDNILYQPVLNNVSTESLENRVLNFQESRNTGYMIQFVGMATTAVGLAIENPNVAAAGSVLGLVGFGVTWSAGGRLRPR